MVIPMFGQEQPQYFVTFDGTGNIAGFYVDTIHVDIPASAVPITVEQWQAYAAAPHLYRLDGETIREKTPEEIEAERAQRTPAPPTLQQRVEAAEQALIALMEAMSDV
jgi:hypothetical protein